MAQLWRQVETSRRECQGHSCDSKLNDLTWPPQVSPVDKLLIFYCNIFLYLQENNSLQDPNIESIVHNQVSCSSNNVVFEIETRLPPQSQI